ncbi:Na(+)-translocating NADH-quinone reductase subunit C [Agaribacterium haliotis]|uniref:Na(+)-translocating NADH-quinone reductase subunit C n=1 Tax=Agaribacterium haliotis TaxID=2013869 RepID=UPI000BB53913|nr:Na(+)-translocating NADH-quinone reductase subunit C [Agaribacterium haliotis]
MANNDTIKKTVTVTLALCIVCSIIVSAASVALKPMQQKNKQQDFNRNILMASGLYDPSLSVEEQFKQVETRVVDLRTGKYSSDLDGQAYDQRKASKDPKLSRALDKKEDIAGIKREEFYAQVYLINDQQGKLEKIILPIRGYGLWSTLYGFLALESDLQTVVGIGYYEHGETPGLGGEVDNPNWKALWGGKQAFNADGSVALTVIKGQVGSTTPQAESKIDGLSGATLTTNGVDNMIKFWLGQQGFGPFIQNLKAGEA